jgi:hypothetical protein
MKENVWRSVPLRHGTKASGLLFVILRYFKKTKGKYGGTPRVPGWSGTLRPTFILEDIYFSGQLYSLIFLSK